MLRVDVEPDIVEQCVNDLRGGASDEGNFDFSDGLDCIIGALVPHKACVKLRPATVHLFSIKFDIAMQDVLRTRRDGLCLIGQHQESLTVYGQYEHFLMLIKAKRELPRSFAALQLQWERARICQLLVPDQNLLFSNLSSVFLVFLWYSAVITCI